MGVTVSESEGEILPTIFLEHEQFKNLAEINARRDVDLAIERRARGAFSTDFHPAYDLPQVWEKIKGQQT